MSRIGGGGKKVFRKDAPGIDHLEVWQETLTDAAGAVSFRLAAFDHTWEDSASVNSRAALAELRDPDKEAIARADGRAETLITDAQALDPRLVRKPSWVRSCEGESACPALLLAGEENPFFARRRVDTAQPVSGDPVLVTVSTDSSEVSPDSLAAFIATVKIVQQFRPVHVVWQGAWMVDYCRGFVFHVPLVTGDMDFERLAFVINSQLRDRVSFSFMVQRAIRVTRQRWSHPDGKAEHPAERSYLPGSVDFIDHAGIAPDAESIAARACRWLGWEAPWLSRYNERSMSSSALCRWEEGEESMRPEYKYEEPSPETRAKWAADEKERARRSEEKKKEEAARRLSAVQ